MRHSILGERGLGASLMGQPVDDSRLSYYTITQLLGRKTATLARKNDNFFRFFHMEIHDAEKSTKNGYAIIIDNYHAYVNGTIYVVWDP